MAHTGSLAGSVEVFDALARELGVVRADTLDDAVEAAELLAHTGAPRGRRLGAITLSGAFRGLILDAAERNALELPALAPQTTQRLDAVLGVGSLVSNPIDGGFGVLTSANNYMASIEAMQGTRASTCCCCRRPCRAREAPRAAKSISPWSRPMRLRAPPSRSPS